MHEHQNSWSLLNFRRLDNPLPTFTGEPTISWHYQLPATESGYSLIYMSPGHLWPDLAVCIFVCKTCPIYCPLIQQRLVTYVWVPSLNMMSKASKAAFSLSLGISEASPTCFLCWNCRKCYLCFFLLLVRGLRGTASRFLCTCFLCFNVTALLYASSTLTYWWLSSRSLQSYDRAITVYFTWKVF